MGCTRSIPDGARPAEPASETQKLKFYTTELEITVLSVFTVRILSAITVFLYR